MKTLIAFLLLLSTYAHSQSTLVPQERQSIIGTWVIDNETNNKWLFTANNTCVWKLNEETLDLFTYSISSEFSSNGVEHTYLKLIKINNSNEIYEYAINSINNNKMTLETFEPKLSYISFTKQ
ncbi:hypothetical protein [Flavobacterium sp.]|jgi:hypothetical protein|uniref:hypothetical protein n=1 Tax=Flavobacterium sp. TaxID=239 RepID=UPI0037C03217